MRVSIDNLALKLFDCPDHLSPVIDSYACQCRDLILSVIAEVFDDILPPNETLKVDSINIDLGYIGYDFVQREKLYKIIVEALARQGWQLSQNKTGGRKASNSIAESKTSSHANVYHLESFRNGPSKTAVITAKHLSNNVITRENQAVKINLNKDKFNLAKKIINNFSSSLRHGTLPGNLYELNNIAINSIGNQTKRIKDVYPRTPFLDISLGISLLSYERENSLDFQNQDITTSSNEVGDVTYDAEDKISTKINANDTHASIHLAQYESLNYCSSIDSTQIYTGYKREINEDLISFSKENFSLADQPIARYSYSAVEDCPIDISPYQDAKQLLIRSLFDNLGQTSILLKDDLSDNSSKDEDNTKNTHIFFENIQKQAIQNLETSVILEEGNFLCDGALENGSAKDRILIRSNTQYPKSIFSPTTLVKASNFNKQKHVLAFNDRGQISSLKMVTEGQDVIGQSALKQSDKIGSSKLSDPYIGMESFDTLFRYARLQSLAININEFALKDTKSSTQESIFSSRSYQDAGNLYDIADPNRHVSLLWENNSSITGKKIITEKCFHLKALPRINIQNLEKDELYKVNPNLLRTSRFNEEQEISILTSLVLLILESDELENGDIKNKYIKKLTVDYLNLLFKNYEWQDLTLIPISAHTIITSFLIKNKIDIKDSYSEVKSIIDTALTELNRQSENYSEETYLATLESDLSLKNLVAAQNPNEAITLASSSSQLIIKDKCPSNRKLNFETASITAEHKVSESSNGPQKESIESRVCTLNLSQSDSATQILNELLFLRQNCSISHSQPIDALLANIISSALGKSVNCTKRDFNLGKSSFDHKTNKIEQNDNTSSLTLSNLVSTSVLNNGLDELQWIQPVKSPEQETLPSVEALIRWSDNNFESLFYYIFNDKSIPKSLLDSFSTLTKRNCKNEFLAFKSLMRCLNTIEVLQVPLFRLHLEIFVCFGLELLLIIAVRQYRSKGIDQVITAHVAQKYTEIDQFNKGYIIKRSKQSADFQDINRKTMSASGQTKELVENLREADKIRTDNLSLNSVYEISHFTTASFFTFLNRYDTGMLDTGSTFNRHTSNDEVYKHPKESKRYDLNSNSRSHAQTSDSQYNTNQLKKDQDIVGSINISHQAIDTDSQDLIQSNIIKDILVNKINATNQKHDILYCFTNQSFHETSHATSSINGNICFSIISNEIANFSLSKDIENNILTNSAYQNDDLSRLFCHKNDHPDLLMKDLIDLNTWSYLQLNTIINRRLANTKYEYLLDYGEIENRLTEETKSNCHLLESEQVDRSRDDIILSDFIDTLSRFNSPPLSEQYRIKRPDDAYRVEDAGIVLLGPFLRTLWDRCKFNNLMLEDARHKMLELLHWAVWQTGIEADDGDGLDCARIATSLALCGYEEDDFIIDSLNKPSETHCRELQVLLDSLQLHWSVLQRFARSNGLQSMFFQRSGALRKKKESWELKVDKAGHDILLNSCPWSFNMIRLPWTGATILVDWPIEQ